jgi:Fur family ferric uptake transcriptional regulator
MPRKSTRQPHDAKAARLAELKGPWRTFLREKRLNASKARETVVDSFLASSEHVDLPTLLERARRQNPRLGLATVYRAMKLMEEAGLAEARHFGAGAAVYEVAVGREHHDHLICQGCGQIQEFHSDEIERLQEEVARSHGFAILQHRHELYGYCASCRKGGTVSR